MFSVSGQVCLLLLLAINTFVCSVYTFLIPTTQKPASASPSIGHPVTSGSSHPTVTQPTAGLHTNFSTHPTTSSSDINVYGTEFFITFGTNFYPYAFRKFVQIMIYSNTSSHANITIPYQKIFKKIDFHPGQNLYNLSNPGPLDPYHLEIKQKGIILQSSSQIKVFLVNHGGSSTDGFLIYPSESLGTEYLVSTSQPYIHREYTHFQSEFAILSTRNSNHVVIQLHLSNGTITYNNKTYSNGDILEINMNYLDTFQLYHPWDMTGTRVVSVHPVVVISGNRCNVFEIYNGCDHFSEMMPPVERLSRTFIVPEFYDYFNWTIQIVATTHTHVNVKEKDGQDVSKIIKAYEVFELVVEDVATVETTNPVLAIQYVHGIHVVENYDPFMLSCQWVESFQKEYNIIVPDLGFNSYLAMTMDSTAVTSLTIDGTLFTNPLDLLGSTEIDFKGIRYSVFSVKVTPGFHTISNRNNKAFGLVVYGNQDHDSYGFLAGLI